MSHIIKLKDEYGNWIPVPTLKGDTGEQGPKGDTGEQGPKGAKGDTGATGQAATVTVGTTTTGTAGTQASVSNSGTASDPILNFTIPRGQAGGLPSYTTSSPGTMDVGKWTKLGSITFTGAWKGYKALLSVQDFGSNGGSALYDIDIATDNNLSVSRRAVISCINDKMYNKYTNFKIVYATPLYELWVVPSVTHQRYTVTVLSENCSDASANMTYYSNQPFQSEQPAGTVVSATYNPIPNAQLAPMGAFTIKGNNTNASAYPQDITASNVRSMIDAQKTMQHTAMPETVTNGTIIQYIGETTIVAPIYTNGHFYKGVDGSWVEIVYGDPNSVSYDTQTGKTDAQKTQARTNIGAAVPAVDLTANLAVASWAGASAPYTQTVSGLSGVTANSKLDIGLAETATDAQFTEAVAAQIRATGSGTGTVTFKAHGTKPTGALPILIRMVD